MIQIKSRYRKVLHEADVDSIKLCVEHAVTNNVDLEGANLVNANLRNVYLVNANLEGANLQNADLYCAHLEGADLYCAHLVNANLESADLRDANLEGVNLINANLENANLVNANLVNANLVNANLNSARSIINLGSPDKWTAFGWLRDGWLSIRVGCREKRLHEAREYWCDTHPDWNKRQEVGAALDYVEKVAISRGWSTTKPSE